MFTTQDTVIDLHDRCKQALAAGDEQLALDLEDEAYGIGRSLTPSELSAFHRLFCEYYSRKKQFGKACARLNKANRGGPILSTADTMANRLTEVLYHALQNDYDMAWEVLGQAERFIGEMNEEDHTLIEDFVWLRFLVAVAGGIDAESAWKSLGTPPGLSPRRERAALRLYIKPMRRRRARSLLSSF